MLVHRRLWTVSHRLNQLIQRTHDDYNNNDGYSADRNCRRLCTILTVVIVHDRGDIGLGRLGTGRENVLRRSGPLVGRGGGDDVVHANDMGAGR